MSARACCGNPARHTRSEADRTLESSGSGVRRRGATSLLSCPRPLVPPPAPRARDRPHRRMHPRLSAASGCPVHRVTHRFRTPRWHWARMACVRPGESFRGRNTRPLISPLVPHSSSNTSRELDAQPRGKQSCADVFAAADCGDWGVDRLTRWPLLSAKRAGATPPNADRCSRSSG